MIQTGAVFAPVILKGANMKVYIIERETPTERPLPEIVMNGAKAMEIVSEEYSNTFEELGLNPKDEGIKYARFWWISDTAFEGTADIDCYNSSDQWQWRISAHDINLAEQ